MREALRLVEDGQSGLALVRLLKIWPTHRDAGLAEVIDRLGAHLDRSVKGLPKTRKQAHWMDRFANREAADITMLAREAVNAPTTRDCKLRVDALVEWRPDPRTTLPLVEQISVHQGQGRWGKVLTATLKVLLRAGDPRAREAVRTLRDKFLEFDAMVGVDVRKAQIVRLGKFLARFPDPSPPVDSEALRVAVKALADGPAPGRALAYPEKRDTSEALRTAILEDPFSDGTIEVWADQLMEAGDELGEFVTLQLKAYGKGLTKADQATEKRLKKRHRNRLLGALAPVVEAQSAVFRRGLLYGAKTAFRATHYADLGMAPEWRTVVQVQTSAKHLRSGALPHARRYGLRLVPSPTKVLTGPRGFEYLRVSPAPWSRFDELSRSRKSFALEAICVGLPKGRLSEDEARAFDQIPSLPDFNELHLVDDVPHYSSSEARLDRMLGALATHPLLLETPRLVLDGIALYKNGLVDTYIQYRPTGGELIVVGNGSWCWTISSDAEGRHLHGNSADGSFVAVRDIDRMAKGDWASVTLCSPPMAPMDLAFLEKFFEGCEALVLPRAKRR